MPVDKDKHTQVLVTFPKEMLADIEKYWFQAEHKNRNEAIRNLVSKALEEHKKERVDQ